VKKLLLVALLLLPACAEHRQYRVSTVPVDVAGPLSDKRVQQSIQSTSIERYPGYTIGIVEFDDQGRFWDRNQLVALGAEIIRQAHASQDSGVRMLVFVHGWRNDATVCNEALACFRELVRRIAADEAATSPKPQPLIGIYVGWRGYGSYRWPFEFLSFIDRKNAAERIAAGDVPEFLAFLDALRRDFNMSRKDPSRLVVVGHSLGGTIVFEAVANVFKARLAEVWPGLDMEGNSRVISGFGDLVLLINPAFEAERWHSINELMSTYLSFSKQQQPLLVIASSETDSATATWFPLGQWLTNLFEKTRDAEQRRALMTSIGNYQPFVTHRLCRADLPPGADERVDGYIHVKNCMCDLPDLFPASDLARFIARPSPNADERDEGWGSQPCAAEQRFGPLLLTCDPKVHRGNPFWVVRVSSNVLHEHDGAFNPYFMFFVRQLVFGGLR